MIASDLTYDQQHRMLFLVVGPGLRGVTWHPYMAFVKPASMHHCFHI